jgi:hypothetical protein
MKNHRTTLTTMLLINTRQLLRTIRETLATPAKRETLALAATIVRAEKINRVARTVAEAVAKAAAETEAPAAHADPFRKNPPTPSARTHKHNRAMIARRKATDQHKASAKPETIAHAETARKETIALVARDPRKGIVLREKIVLAASAHRSKTRKAPTLLKRVARAAKAEAAEQRAENADADVAAKAAAERRVDHPVVHQAARLLPAVRADQVAARAAQLNSSI